MELLLLRSRLEDSKFKYDGNRGAELGLIVADEMSHLGGFESTARLTEITHEAGKIATWLKREASLVPRERDALSVR